MFDPQHITPRISLNRVKIVDLPGLNMPDAIKGQTAFQLLGAKTLIALIREHADELDYPPETDSRELPLLLDACFTSAKPQVRAAAQQIAQQMGHSLGYVLLTLKRADRINRDARPEWDDSYWDYWVSLQTMWLGGGLVSGHLGQHMQRHAQRLLDDAGFADFSLNLSAYSATLPIIGAARHAPLNGNEALIFDFGGSFIKLALAKYSNHRLIALKRLKPLPAAHLEPQPLFDYMVRVIVETQASLGIIIPTVLISIACYVVDGRLPADQTGNYAQLRLIADNVQEALATALSKQLKQPILVQLLHDGTAAAATYAGSPQTAVLMLGTALGVGFPPPSDEHLCPFNDLEAK